MVWEEGPPHSIQTLTFPLSSSKYKQSSCKISNQNHLKIQIVRHRLKVTVSNLVHAKMAMSSLQWYPYKLCLIKHELEFHVFNFENRKSFGFLIGLRFRGYRCKSGIAIFAQRLEGHLKFCLQSPQLPSSLKNVCVESTPIVFNYKISLVLFQRIII